MPWISIVTSVEAAPAWRLGGAGLAGAVLLLERDRHRVTSAAAAATAAAAFTAAAAGRGQADEHHSEYESQFHSIPSMASASSDDRNGRPRTRL